MCHSVILWGSDILTRVVPFRRGAKTNQLRGGVCGIEHAQINTYTQTMNSTLKQGHSIMKGYM